MQLYQFERIYSQMEKEFGKMRKGEEEVYSMLLLPLEGNALKYTGNFHLQTATGCGKPLHWYCLT